MKKNFYVFLAFFANSCWFFAIFLGMDSKTSEALPKIGFLGWMAVFSIGMFSLYKVIEES